MGVEQKLGNMGVVTTTLEAAVNWARTNAMWPMMFGLACCAIEMMAAQAADFDMSRFGMELMRPSPRQSDLMIVAGRVTRKMAPVVRRLYDQMPDPKWVISMGACASSGGMFRSYAVVQGIDQFMPVDVYVAGCPPRPENLLLGLMELQRKKGNSPIFETLAGMATEASEVHRTNEYAPMEVMPLGIVTEVSEAWRTWLP